jgi:hypothetical protein
MPLDGFLWEGPSCAPSSVTVEFQMNEEHKGKTAMSQRPAAKGEHGGNRAGKHNQEQPPPKSSQSAGKDPHRGES